MPKLAQIYKILLVDDDPFSLDVIVEFLDGEGYCLFLSASGEEALEKLIEPNSGFDILVLDVNLPGIDGYEVLRRISATPGIREIPVIMQSSEDFSQTRCKNLRTNIYGYLVKPFAPEALRNIIRSAINELDPKRHNS